MFLLGLLVRQRLEELGCLHQQVAGVLGNGQHGLDVLHQSHVGLLLSLAFELQLWVDVDIGELHVLNAVTTIEHFAHLDGRHKGGVTGIGLS